MLLRRRYHISQLPEELIINILSRLTLQESGRTYVLSRRWKNLGLLTNHCSGPNLIFKTPIYKELAVEANDSIVRRKRLLYIGFLNKVFKSHQQPLDELVINFYLNSEFSVAIDNWIKFAFTKNVQRLELNLAYGSSKPYAFCAMSNGSFRLRVLRLKGVYIDQTIVDDLLSSCPLLDSLSLKPWKLGNLTISRVKLRDLDLSNCLSKRKRIGISAPNLVKFGYEGYTRALHLKCVPSLTEFYVWDRDSRPFFMKMDSHFSYISRLKKLKLFASLSVFMEFPLYPLALPQPVKLEEFEVKIMGFDGGSFLWPLVFIRASPFLRRFVVEMDVYVSSLKEGYTGRLSEGDKRRIKEATKFKHGFLKVVEINRFGGWGSEIELAQHLIYIGAQSLEKVVIDTRTPIRKPPNGAGDLRKLARSVGLGLDSSVDFVVL